jgi:hypothetical protein
MLDSHLLPPGTVITAKGEGVPLDISAASGKTLLLTLKISEIVEQEALDVSVWGSADGVTWDAKPLAAFPQKFYAGEHPLLRYGNAYVQSCSIGERGAAGPAASGQHRGRQPALIEKQQRGPQPAHCRPPSLTVCL